MREGRQQSRRNQEKFRSLARFFAHLPPRRRLSLSLSNLLFFFHANKQTVICSLSNHLLPRALRNGRQQAEERESRCCFSFFLLLLFFFRLFQKKQTNSLLLLRRRLRDTMVLAELGEAVAVDLPLLDLVQVGVLLCFVFVKVGKEGMREKGDQNFLRRGTPESAEKFSKNKPGFALFSRSSQPARPSPLSALSALQRGLSARDALP